ncbi:MAG: homocysteine S-methyltransferase family protein, partial [Synergistaceae bacterium]|nr:homocysteine S-methyltransferase family protein [Synergistaceae bacterium]
MQERGLAVGECPDEWSISHPDTVTEIAVSYLAAGADMVETNSFGANRFKLGQFGLADKAAEINEAAARASRNALRGALDKFVIASVGPTGKMLVAEEVTESGLYDAFSEQVVALERGGADAVCIETMTDITEAAIAIKAARENTSLEIIATFTFDRTVQGTYRTM